MSFLLAFTLGALTGLRSMTPPAAISWAAHLGWINLSQSPLAFMGATVTMCLFSVLAVGELIADKLPFIPSRLAAGPLAGRILLGGLCGAALCAAGGQSILGGAALGAVGGIAGSFAGYHARATLVHTALIPDVAVALVEDAITIGGALFIVSRG
jgi:uncharacterized membrane protein